MPARHRMCLVLSALIATLCTAIPRAGAAPLKEVFADRPNAVEFSAQEARFVRFVIRASSGGGQPCVDELELYGPESDNNLALADAGATASASSCLTGYAEHTIAHLNDGSYGNGKSWIAAGTGEEWAQIELSKPATVNRVVYSRDRDRNYGDRMPTDVEVLLSQDGQVWTSVARVQATAGPVALVSRAGNGGGLVPPPPPPPDAAGVVCDADADPVKDAFLAEEYAWIKTAGRADVDPRLVPYNGRVKEYPHHVGDDALPLPALSEAPDADGKLNDACWKGASRGAVRVAYPFDFAATPLVTTDIWAGRHGGLMWFALRTDRLLSSHVAVVSSADLQGCGVVELTRKGLVFSVHKDKDGQLSDAKPLPLQGAFSRDLTRFEFGLPLSLFPDCEKQGLRVGLGLGGRYTEAMGRPITFTFASFGMAQTSPYGDGQFTVRFAREETATPRTIHADCASAAFEVPLGFPILSQDIRVPAEPGPVGPQATLSVREGGNEYTLHLLRYDPLDHTLNQMEDMIARLEKQGVNVAAERAAVADFRARHKGLLAAAEPDLAAERAAFYEARLAKRNVFLRAPDLEPMRDLLFIKRFPFEPSHNYSDYFDSAFKPGGGVCLLHLPKEGDRFAPEKAQVRELFQAGKGIARNPMADFDLNRIYFSYRLPEDGYYHVMSMNPDGSDLKQITSGPFQDLWPTPLPDGDIALISSRCTSRFICWRPQASILFRMKPDGTDFRPLSYANLTEWAPSVMDDGRLVWTRSEYQDKGADFGHTLWAVKPDGTQAELVFGNDIIQPNGYANGRPVPGTKEYVCTLISHFGDLNGPIALVDPSKGRSNPKAITSLTPEVPWPGMWPNHECFREACPLSRDYFLCAHAPRETFGLFVIDRFGNRELLHTDPAISSMCPTVFQKRPHPPVLAAPALEAAETGEFYLQDVYRGISPPVERGRVKYIRIVEEVRATLDQMPNGEYRKDHPEFQDWYATPVHKVSGPFGWPTYVAKQPCGLVPVNEDGSARFTAPAGRVLYFEALDKDYNELQRMRSVVQLQSGERRGCIGCHENRLSTPANGRRPEAKQLQTPALASWEGVPLSFEKVVQPVLDARCVSCHNGKHAKGLDLRGDLDTEKVPVSYRTLVEKGLVHYADMGWNSGGTEKLPPLSLGTLKSRLWEALNAGHHDVVLTDDEMLRIKTWIDLNCPLWPDYKNRLERPDRVASSN